MRKIKQSTTKNIMVLMVDSTDHVTGKTGLTLTITASKDGAAFASITPTVTERGNGWYNLALTAAHTDTLGDLALHITGTAADPTDLVLLVEAGATDADVSSRMAAYTQPTGFLAATFPTTVASPTNITAGTVTTVSGNVNGSVGSVTGLTAANLDATISSRLASASYTAPDNATITLTRQLLSNKRVLNIATGVETIYDDAGLALYTRNVYGDAAGTTLYDGTNAPHRVEKYT